MVSVDQGCFDLDQVQNHFVGWVQAVVEDLFHHIMHFRLQLIITLELRKLDLKHKPSQLLVYVTGAVKTRL